MTIPYHSAIEIGKFFHPGTYSFKGFCSLWKGEHNPLKCPPQQLLICSFDFVRNMAHGHETHACSSTWAPAFVKDIEGLQLDHFEKRMDTKIPGRNSKFLVTPKKQPWKLTQLVRISPCLIGIHLHSRAPIFQPVMLDYQSVYPWKLTAGYPKWWFGKNVRWLFFNMASFGISILNFSGVYSKKELWGLFPFPLIVANEGF